ncbi:hypothetical protein SAMN05444972_105306 [Marininema halotolerans]|uniref:Uncharacterized protein n=1 Tax=Marininema halotolerans TaxID=1155944 RepID=A0A1I6RQZ1_9BACL|nr:hypothetical protein SAMN05444972_105306 [Marininema halotolerans]
MILYHSVQLLPRKHRVLLPRGSLRNRSKAPRVRSRKNLLDHLINMGWSPIGLNMIQPQPIVVGEADPYSPIGTCHEKAYTYNFML